MLYAIIGRDHPDSLDRRLAVRAEHLVRLEALQDAGRLVLAGPFPAIPSEDPGLMGFDGSLIVAEFSTLAEAEAWAAADPYTLTGVFKSVEVKPFKQVFPK